MLLARLSGMFLDYPVQTTAHPALAHPSVAGFDGEWSRRSLMAKSQNRSSREQKKPKQGKPKPTGGQSAFAGLHERPAVPTATKKK